MSEEQQGIYEPEEIPNDYGDMGRGEVDDSINDDLRDQAYNEDDIFEPEEEPAQEQFPDAESAETVRSQYKRVSQVMTTASIGLVYLKATVKVDGKPTPVKLPCTACMYQMAMNRIPVATVYVGMGSSLMWPTARSAGPETLLKAIEDRDSNELVHNMLPCELYEEHTDNYGVPGKDLLIFRGYIASATPVYQTSAAGSSMQIQFSCFGLAAALMTSPVAAYTEAYMGAVMERYERSKPMSKDETRTTGDLLIGFRYDLDQLMQTDFMNQAHGTSIADRVARCVGAVRVGSAWLHTKSSKFKKDVIVSTVLGGTCRLKLNANAGNGLGDDCDEAFTEQLLSIVMTRMEQVNLWDTIQSTLTSDVFMLQLMPRWSCDARNDFKIEVGPCTAWKPRRIITLAAGDIVSFKMQHTSFGSLNTPDVFFVNFSDPLACIGSSAPELSFGILGVAARTKELQDKLRMDAVHEDLEELNKDTINCRIKEVPAPQWLSCVAPSRTVLDPGKRDNKVSLAVEHTPSRVSQELAGPDAAGEQPSLKKPTSPDNPRKATAWDAANTIARTLFLHYFMTGDEVTLELLPDVRFGLKKDKGIFLENSIGDTIEVDLTDSASGSGLKMRGVLESISYQYAAGQSSTATYTATLTRVRMLDANTPEDEECPIYTSGDIVE